ncbi:MAG: pseudouridine synthase [Butyricicoccaceae bacterium]
MKQRLQKLLSQAGICSRRASEPLIQSGSVTVNGVPAKLGDSADPDVDDIRVNGIPLKRQTETHCLMMNKPVNVVTTMHDERGRKTVAMLVERYPHRVLPVGRLDQWSEGLLLLTDDGALLHDLTHPSHDVDKQYEVTVRGDAARLHELSQPMEIDGYRIRPAQVKRLRTQPDGTMVLLITIHEGRNRQIRKMCAQCGFRVLRLKRIAIGPLKLDPSLKPGTWRELRLDERKMLEILRGAR